MAAFSLLLLLLLSLSPALLAMAGEEAGGLEYQGKASNGSMARRELRGCKTGNPIDDCWRCGNWRKHRKQLASCGIGFGKGAMGGVNGRYYVVTDSSDDSPASPKPGTLRHAVVQNKPLWITFARSMTIKLSIELIMNSYKTIDGRGANVEIAYGAGITIQAVTNIIIHSVRFHNCRSAGPGLVMSNPQHVGHRQVSDGDGISIFTGSKIWIDHCYFSRCQDGLIDVIHASTDISITNSYFEQHDKVMLLGHNDAFSADKNMRVTVAYNKFGPGLGQRMPRCRFGLFHVLNNDYTSGWGVYAVGGSANPTIVSRGNIYSAGSVKEVTKRDVSGQGWHSWPWTSNGDAFLNGAYFVQSGTSRSTSSLGGAGYSPVLAASYVSTITANAGPL